ncbi:MAG: hypothetical protein H6751_05655 [Candidatus Omnitrophica bacterium]|nr:hypothetical protein [Candidatus Omnitrophota bacterium]MCA9424268.1 hypothetical protein [Candidatus Omnitrophota bacterium]MCB9768974.1 hypothetical protein [Candidatus Omnitrophota bacterium]MCB9782428.1 hypothetical protein [Candidatus Omnitrophota bacterium]
MPAGDVRFWFQPTTDRVVLFFVTLFGIFLLIRGLKVAYRRSLQKRDEKGLREKLERCNLTERPEEALVRELVERYRVRPPSQLLSSLQQFDSIASEEIARIERERMDLADRLDRIEFMYSIRMNAFSNEPSVGGLETILGPRSPVGQTATIEPDTETLVREPASDQPEDGEPDLDQLESRDSNDDEMPFTDEEITNLKTLLSIEDEDESEPETAEEETPRD